MGRKGLSHPLPQKNGTSGDDSEGCQKDDKKKGGKVMKGTLLYVCRCGAIRAIGDWGWNKTPLSAFIQRAIKKEVLQIDFEVVVCPNCLKNNAKNGKQLIS